MALPSVYDICVPRDDVLQGSITESDFAADLAQVLRADAPEEYTDPVKFFANTYPTRGLKALLVNVCHRLNASSKQIAAIFRLDTNYGGGKTHDLVALRHAAKGRSAAWPWKHCATRSGSRNWLHTSRIGSRNGTDVRSRSWPWPSNPGLSLHGEEPEKISQRLTKFGTGACFGLATAEASS